MSQTTAPPSTTVTAPLESPAAHRLTLRRWRDPRLWVGLVLVASSVLVGARVLTSADDTVGVWAVARDLGEGAPLTPDSLVVERVRFADPATAGRYLPAGGPLPAAAVAGHDLAAGELLARGSVVARRGTAFELPVVVDTAGAPEDVHVGDVVDVWVGPQPGSGSDAAAQRMLTAVPVVGAVRSAGPFGEAATRQVLLGLDEATAERLGPLLGEMSSGSVVLVRHGAGR
ncbi:MAG: hypothetical protein M3165_05810 [Actinomycetota bacterium]|nr:hypothetical protein [Actinomycetota bacterium]